MFQRLTLGTTLVLLTIGLVGCGDSGPVNVSEGADEQSIEEYKAMVAAEEAANAGSNKNVAKPPK